MFYRIMNDVRTVLLFVAIVEEFELIRVVGGVLICSCFADVSMVSIYLF
jgi:hypothetical protein